MIVGREWPLMQFSPRLTGASGSPWVATTLPSCTPTITAQPVPQKRQGALSQRTPASADAAAAGLAGAASTTMGMPAAAAVALSAWVLMKSRRLVCMAGTPVPDGCLGSSARMLRRQQGFFLELLQVGFR